MPSHAHLEEVVETNESRILQDVEDILDLTAKFRQGITYIAHFRYVLC